MYRVLFVLLFVAACGGASAPGPRAPAPRDLATLDYVPADTPYVLAWLDALPDAIWERWTSNDLMQKAFAVNRANLAKKAKSEWTLADRMLAAYLDELEGGDFRAALERTGIGRNPRLVVYGLSVHPAVRVEVTSATRLRATIERILGKAKVPYDVAKVGGVEVLTTTTPDDDVAVFAFPSEHVAVGGLFPSAQAERYTRQLLGIELPKTSLAGTGRLQRLFDEAGGAYLAGFVDLRALLRELGADLDATCRAEALSLIELAPAIETFSSFADDRQMSMTFRLATDPRVSEALAELAVPVPGLTDAPAGTPLLLVGVGVDLDALDALLARAAGEVRARPFRCARLQGLNEAAARVAGGILQHIPPPFDRLRGAQVTIDAVKPVIAHVVAIHDRPLDLLAMAAQVMPSLAGAPVRDDGTPVEIDASALGIPGVSKVTLAVDGTRLAASVGRDDVTVRQLVAAPAAEPAPLAVFAMDFDRFTELFGTAPFADQPELASLMEGYGYLAYALHLDRRGLALRITVELD